MYALNLVRLTAIREMIKESLHCHFYNRLVVCYMCVKVEMDIIDLGLSCERW